jgi:hypothetical protein
MIRDIFVVAMGVALGSELIVFFNAFVLVPLVRWLVL